MKKQNIAIIGVIAFVLAVAVGYALFSQTLTINGTATANGSFDVQFIKVGTPTSLGYTKSTDTDLASISNGGKTLTITVNKLDYPGAYVEIPVTIENKGSIPAKLKEIVQTGLNDETGPIKVSYSGVAASEDPIKQNDTQDMKIRVEWLSGVNSSTEDKGVQIKIELKYEQVTA